MEDFNEEQIKEIYKVARELVKEYIDAHSNKTWIVIEWKEYIYEPHKYPPLHLNTCPIKGKKAIKLYCIETGEKKDI